MNRRRLQTSSRPALVVVGVMLAAAMLVSGPAANASGFSAAAKPAVHITEIDYDSADAQEYNRKWTYPYGPLDGASQTFGNGRVTIADVPFKAGTDFSVFDHLKYIAVSSQAFPVPRTGTIVFSVNITATTPGTQPGPGGARAARPAWFVRSEQPVG